MENIHIVFEYAPMLLEGLLNTILVSVCAIIIALVIGIILSVLRMGGDSRPARIVRGIINVYISFVRGTPVLVQIYIIYQALAVIGLNLSAFVSGVIALSLNSGGFIAEIFRGAFASVSEGQYESAEALGMTKRQTLTRIVFPQVFKIAMPQLTSEFMNVIKLSPMLSVLAIVELTRTAQRLSTQTFITLPFYIAIAVLYFVVCAALEELVKRQKRAPKKVSRG